MGDIFTTRPIGHDEARACAQRFIDSHFGNSGKERPRLQIPADPDRDDDLVLVAYIEQQRTKVVSEEEIRAEERRKCWEAVNAMIVRGPLQGSGWDKTAERNGLVLAANALFDRKEGPAA